MFTVSANTLRLPPTLKTAPLSIWVVDVEFSTPTATAGVTPRLFLPASATASTVLVATVWRSVSPVVATSPAMLTTAVVFTMATANPKPKSSGCSSASDEARASAVKVPAVIELLASMLICAFEVDTATPAINEKVRTSAISVLMV